MLGIAEEDHGHCHQDAENVEQICVARHCKRPFEIKLPAVDSVDDSQPQARDDEKKNRCAQKDAQVSDHGSDDRALTDGLVNLFGAHLTGSPTLLNGGADDSAHADLEQHGLRQHQS